jgi:PAS domain S-box-containing protein
MHSSHDGPLVALSILISVLASYTALALAGRVTAAHGGARRAWLLGGSVAMGIGIWSMHFVAMLAFRLPVGVAYDVPLVVLSLLAAVGASALALVVASRPVVGASQLLGAATLMGGGVAAMHYIGMAAMRLPARLEYRVALVALSLAIAIGASLVALWITRRLRVDVAGGRFQVLRAGAAVILGLAIAGLHYTGMAAARFVPDASRARPTGGFVLVSDGLAAAVVIGTLLILLFTLLGSLVDHWVRVKLAGAEALRDSEARYRSVVGQVREVIFHTDADGRWRFLNPAWTEITGYTEEQSLGTTLFDYVHPEDRDRERAAFLAIARGSESSAHREVRYLTRDGGVRWIEVHARVNRDAAGALVGTAGTLRDITDRRLAEEAARAAREAAEAANRAKSEFLSRMSHELRTPLNAILGFGQLMEMEDDLSPDNRESVAHILKGGRHLLDLINEVLDMTGIEAGHMRLSPEPVAVAEVVGEVVDLLRPLAARRAITLRADDAQGCTHHVLADRQRLKQVLLNLLSNAIKYNREAGSIVVACDTRPDARLRISVRDTGPGLPAESMDRLFTPFERLGAERTLTEGTGLGLALSKRIVEAMDGTIGAESHAPDGSTFWLELSVAAAPVGEWGADAGADLQAARAHPGVSRRILYVEDNVANLTLVRRILTRWPEIELITSMQGELALDLARRHRPDLVLLDLHLPGIPGEEVLRALRGSPETRAIPVVVVSADVTSGREDRLLAQGAHAFLAKPLDVLRFTRLVDELLATPAVAA